MNWHIWKCSGIVCSCSTERGIRERENEMSGIVIEKVRKSFDTKDGVVEALKDVNLNIDSGDIYGIIGMSGAGKSTLVRCMNFLEVPTEGQVLIDGKALGDLTEKELKKQREEIGMIFQHFNLLMQKSVIDNVCFPLYIKGKKKAEARKRAWTVSPPFWTFISNFVSFPKLIICLRLMVTSLILPISNIHFAQ